VLFTALAFTPFLTQVGIADRFVLLASAGYCIGLALAFACVWDRPRRWERALGGALIATLVTAWAIDLYGRAGDWRAAGLLARRIVVETKALVPNPPAGARIEIFGVPGILGAAVVFPTYIDRALLDEYGRHDITVYWEADDDLVRRCQLQSDAAAGTFVVWWDSAKARMRADTERCPPSHAAHSPGSQGATEVGGRMTMLLSVSAALWRSISAIPQANDFPHGLFFSFGALVWLTLDAG
jgi:hypothetical protein